jgi:hypothetical protein
MLLAPTTISKGQTQEWSFLIMDGDGMAYCFVRGVDYEKPMRT